MDCFKEFCDVNALKGARDKNLFYVLNTEVTESSLKELKKQLTHKERNWLLYSVFSKMDSFYKMHALNRNRDLSVHFVKIKKDGSSNPDYHDIGRTILEILRESKSSVGLHLDLQGLDFSNSFAFYNWLSIIKNGQDIHIETIIESPVRLNGISAPILDELQKLEINELRTGISIFAHYGKTDYLRNVLKRNQTDSPLVSRLMAGMQYVEEGVSLCNIPVMEFGINGAAIAMVAGTAGALIFSMIYLYRADAFISICFCLQEKITLSFNSFKAFFQMWKRVFGENLMTRVGTLLASSITAWAGSFATAIYAVGMHLMNVNFTLGSGLQAASVALIGLGDGEGRDDKIDSYSKTLLSLGLTFGLILSAVMVVFAKSYFFL